MLTIAAGAEMIPAEAIPQRARKMMTYVINDANADGDGDGDGDCHNKKDNINWIRLIVDGES